MAQILGLIRTKTRDLHARLEAGFDLTSRLRSREDYTSLLSRYLGLYRPFETFLQTQSPTLHDAIGWPDSQRVPRLEADLEALGLSPETIADVPHAPQILLPESPDALWGALYVLEGSNLGGQIIYRQINERLGLDQHAGAAFFYGDGPGTGTHWKHFLHALEAHVTKPEQAADAASIMFEHFESWLTPNSNPDTNQDSIVRRPN